ncbi:hypothetical protein BDP81DRAFT_332022 [Colletotrichum phormii]|uniref:DUF6594 domain-containing protein n=1 Tax=Colletotrichum phormii TaxID=359342 RepID=A0AAJ0EA35_9PEZI|nr:uncharacterized protein BDP81DRAFT_332022 [Colletotrichum phormii]KAK1623490.1 hypothetical protein BDP81DRAFT_332022 [Colletotrichum phormii]
MASSHSEIPSYARFAEFSASDPELTIFRSFQVLASRNLLYLQSAMLEIENEMRELDEEDARDMMNLEVLLSTKCWETFSARAKENCEREAARMRLVARLKETSEDYYEALLLQSQVMKFPKPNDRVFRVFRGWFETEQPFVGYGTDLLSQRSDFIALSPSNETDFLTRSLPSLAGRYLPGSRHETMGDVKYYSARHVTRLVTIITVLAASLVIQAAIITLYLLRNEALRLCMIAVFTSVFAASLAVMTDGRRTDIILATAACAAVLVAFVAQD